MLPAEFQSKIWKSWLPIRVTVMDSSQPIIAGRPVGWKVEIVETCASLTGGLVTEQECGRWKRSKGPVAGDVEVSCQEKQGQSLAAHAYSKLGFDTPGTPQADSPSPVIPSSSHWFRALASPLKGNGVHDANRLLGAVA